MKRFRTAVVFRLWLAAAAFAQQPPAPLEFYGYACTSEAAPQLGFLRQGSQIIIAAEGDVIQDQYRLVDLGLDAAVVEDMASKRRQTLPLVRVGRNNDSDAASTSPSVERAAYTRKSRVAAKPTRAAQSGAAPVEVKAPIPATGSSASQH